MRFGNVHGVTTVIGIVLAWFMIGDLGPPDSHQALAGETNGGSTTEDSQPATTTTTGTNSEFGQHVKFFASIDQPELEVTLQVEGDLLETRFAKQVTHPVGTLIRLIGQNVECETGSKELAEVYADHQLGIEALVVSKIINRMLTRSMILRFDHKGRSYSFEPKSNELASCKALPRSTDWHRVGLYELFGQIHFLFALTNDDIEGSPVTVKNSPADTVEEGQQP